MLTLTEDQQSAVGAFLAFMADPHETVFVLTGYSGTGKSTLVEYLVDKLPDLMRSLKLINPGQKDYHTEFTATTNKAAESLAHIIKRPVSTIQSFLQLVVQPDRKTGESKLVPRKHGFAIFDSLIFIDEASFTDANLLNLIFAHTRQCKIVFIGDPAQLTPVKGKAASVFTTGFPSAALTKVVRNTGPILELSTQLRETVNTGEFFQFTPDGTAIQHHSRDDFDDLLLQEVSRPDWRYHDSKFLAWTNKRVVDYNHAIQTHITGDPAFQEGDYAICNKYITGNRITFKTDQLVQITKIEENVEEYGLKGNFFTLDHRAVFFSPYSLQEKKGLLAHARKNGQLDMVAHIEDRWVDLRSAYAQTVNKSQGSTYDKVFIDLDDISRCNSGNQIARMLYVAVSRARHQVHLVGDLV